MEGKPEAEEEEKGARQAPAEECECEEGAPAWVVTFGDLMSLLLTFFVLLLSFSRMDNERFKELAGSLQDAFGVQRIMPVFDLPRGIDLVARDFNTTFSADQLEKQIKSTVKRLKKEVEEGEDAVAGVADGEVGDDEGEGTDSGGADGNGGEQPVGKEGDGGLQTFEVNFGYVEEGAKKNTLVKVRLCPMCAPKLTQARAMKAAKAGDGAGS